MMMVQRWRGQVRDLRDGSSEVAYVAWIQSLNRGRRGNMESWLESENEAVGSIDHR